MNVHEQGNSCAPSAGSVALDGPTKPLKDLAGIVGGVVGLPNVLITAGLPIGLVVLCAWSFVRYSKTKEAKWAIIGALAGAAFLSLLVGALILSDRESVKFQRGF